MRDPHKSKEDRDKPLQLSDLYELAPSGFD